MCAFKCTDAASSLDSFTWICNWPFFSSMWVCHNQIQSHYCIFKKYCYNSRNGIHSSTSFFVCVCEQPLFPLSSLVSISVQGRFFEWLVGDRTLMWWEALRSISYKQRFTTYYTSPHSTLLFNYHKNFFCCFGAEKKCINLIFYVKKHS